MKVSKTDVFFCILVNSFGSAIILPHFLHLVTSNGSYIGRPRVKRITATCKCGCGQQFQFLPCKPRQFLNTQHYHRWLKGKNHPQYKTGAFVKDPKTGRFLNQDEARKVERLRMRERRGINKKYAEDELAYESGRRKYPPFTRTENVVRGKIAKECPVCHGTFYVKPSEKDVRETCSKECANELSGRKRDERGRFR